MSKLESDEADSVKGSEFTQEEFAARFLLRALEELRLVNGNIAVSDLQFFADTLIRQMGLMIGTEEFLRGQFDVIDQLNFHDAQAHYKTVDHLSEKIIQSQQNLARKDRNIPF